MHACRSLFAVIIALLLYFQGNAQEGFPINGVHETKAYIHLKNFYLYTPEGFIEDAEMLIYDHTIKAIGKKVKAPENTVVHDLEGQYVYPSFIELYADHGIEKKTLKKKNSYPQYKSLKPGPFHWNQAIQPERSALDFFNPDTFKAKASVDKGIGASLIHYTDGIIRGTSFLYLPSHESTHENTVAPEVGMHFSLSKGSSKQTYPSAQMGVLALLKQTFMDAAWYAEAQTPSTNLSLEKLNAAQGKPFLFTVSDHLEVERVLKLGEAQNFDPIIYTGGDDYKNLKLLQHYHPKLIVPLKCPEPYDVSDPYASKWVKLSELKDWELAPSNAYFLEQKGIPFAFDIKGLKNWKELHRAILKVYERGLSEKSIVQALSKTPAEWLGLSSRIGMLEPGQVANFIVLDQPIIQKNTTLIQNWVNGHKNEVQSSEKNDVRGRFTLNIDGQIYELSIKGKKDQPEGTVSFAYQRRDSLTQEFVKDTAKSKVKIILNEDQISMSAQFSEKPDKSFQIHGLLNLDLGIIDGNGKNGLGQWVVWNAIRKEKHKKDKDQDVSVTVDSLTLKNVWYPNMAYGFDSIPEAQTFFIKNTTIWTNEKEGVLKNASLLVQNGIIKKINSNSVPSDAIVIDGTGMHVTPGIIDEHSHIAISKGVNESGQAVSAEVSIGDVIRPNDINIFRQLAGGVTTAQLLHGSANPIGGQSAIIKLRWGVNAEQMKFKEAPPFIKFALGENVKQSNWGQFNVTRFPQTRMGVEQVYYDAFYRAKNYQNKIDRKEEAPARKDLELETLRNIVEGKTFITCHSYVQSEMNMLMHVADSMGFKINTFTHVLEGYKIADKLAAHGAGGSTFADWWAYKYEVRDAIPYNAALMHEQGVTVALNSDDAEMGRRLNQEAGKVVKYGGVSEEEALKMITLNPAKLLHIDQYVGSIKEGKHADLVLWSGHPLQAKAKAEKTFIDGILLFDRSKLDQMEEKNQNEKARLIQLMLNDKSEKKKKIQKKEEKEYHCDTLEEHE